MFYCGQPLFALPAAHLALHPQCVPAVQRDHTHVRPCKHGQLRRAVGDVVAGLWWQRQHEALLGGYDVGPLQQAGKQGVMHAGHQQNIVGRHLRKVMRVRIAIELLSCQLDCTLALLPVPACLPRLWHSPVR